MCAGANIYSLPKRCRSPRVGVVKEGRRPGASRGRSSGCSPTTSRTIHCIRYRCDRRDTTFVDSLLRRPEVIRLGVGVDVPAAILQLAQDEHGAPSVAHRYLGPFPVYPFRCSYFPYLERRQLCLFNLYGQGTFEEWQASDIRVEGSQWQSPERLEEQEALNQGTSNPGQSTDSANMKTGLCHVGARLHCTGLPSP